MPPAPQVTRLPNGLRVASDPMPGAGWIALDVFVACSPLDEEPGRAGAAHAIEHMLLGRAGGDQVARLRALDRAGAMNAASGPDHTVYEADVLPERVTETLALLAETLLAPSWGEWEMERRVLVEEAALLADDPADRAETLLRRAVFGPRHPYGRPIEGTPATLGRMSRRALADLHARTHVGARIVVAAAGEVEHRDLVRRVADHLGGLPPGRPRAGRPPRRDPVPARGGRDDGERTHLVAGAPAPPIGDPRWAALAHVDALLGGMWSGRLNVELRERRGLAYDVWSAGAAMWGSGLVSAGLAAAPEALEEAAGIVGRELAALRSGRTDPEDLATAAAYVTDQARLASLGPAHRAGRMGRRLLAGLDVRPVARDLDELAAVRPADVAAAARAVWAPSRIVAVTVGDPPRGLPARLPALVRGRA